MRDDKRRSPAQRILIFVRHGQYHHDPERLTALGRRQARNVARALSALDVSRIHSSTMLRARETAALIAKRLKRRVHANALLCEGLLPLDRALAARILGPRPTPSERAEQRKAMERNRRRAERAFKLLFARPTRGTRTEVVVAHGNVIRYWVCRALDISPTTWTRMDARNGSLTTLTVDQDGECRLLGFGEVGHLPLDERTF